MRESLIHTWDLTVDGSPITQRGMLAFLRKVVGREAYSRAELERILEVVLLDCEAYFWYLRQLAIVTNARYSDPQFTSNENADHILERGLCSLSDEDLRDLAVNPGPLMQMFEEIDECDTEAWEELKFRVGEDLLLNNAVGDDEQQQAPGTPPVSPAEKERKDLIDFFSDPVQATYGSALSMDDEAVDGDDSGNASDNACHALEWEVRIWAEGLDAETVRNKLASRARNERQVYFLDQVGSIEVTFAPPVAVAAFDDIEVCDMTLKLPSDADLDAVATRLTALLEGKVGRVKINQRETVPSKSSIAALLKQLVPTTEG